MQSNNPAFSNAIVSQFDRAYSPSTTMTAQGTALKTFALLGILLGTALFSWTKTGEMGTTGGFLVGASLLGFVTSLAITFRPNWAAWLAPVFAVFEGAFLGSLSRLIEASVPQAPGIAIQAVALTGGVTFLMLFVYATGIVRVTGQLASAVVAATGAIALVYLASMILHLFGVNMPYIHDSGPIGIAFGLFVVGVAAFNLLLDFDFIDKASRAGAAKSMEWYGAFALMVTLVWLYIQILDVLRKVYGDRR